MAEARRLVNTIPEPSRTKAMELLNTGLRLHEYEKVSDGEVVGKGGKRRAVFGRVSKQSVREGRFRQDLARVGLTPHRLRKVFATHLGRQVDVFDLCAVMGWSSVETARSYVGGSEDLAAKVAAVMEDE